MSSDGELVVWQFFSFSNVVWLQDCVFCWFFVFFFFFSFLLFINNSNNLVMCHNCIFDQQLPINTGSNTKFLYMVQEFSICIPIQHNIIVQIFNPILNCVMIIYVIIKIIWEKL
ncbi:hypothetical protein ACP275_13G081200 [Erythranthe tilingii]